MAVTTIWQIPPRKISWAAFVERQQPTQFLIERAKPCEAIATAGTFVRRVSFSHEDETVKRALGTFKKMLLDTDAQSASKKLNAAHVVARRRHVVIRRLSAISPSLPPTAHEHLRQVEERLQSLAASIGEMLHTMTSQTEEAIRLVQEHRAKWQVGNVVAQEIK